MLQFSMVFFFPSRRRHTIRTGDWSSDVCSTDLALAAAAASALAASSQNPARVSTVLRSSTRSEERRVGKECRFRGSWFYLKNKKKVIKVQEIFLNSLSTGR